MDYWVIQKEMLNPQNKLIANEYLENLKNLGLAKYTICTHKRILESFLLNQAKDIKFLNQDDLIYWLETQCSTLKPITHNLILGTLRRFFILCQEQIQNNPA